jgi:hypothetical protein
MSLEKKTKIALDETRLLILGGQILLGFQFHSVFQEQFKTLSEPAKLIDLVAMLLMVMAIALICTPSVYHRLVEEGRLSDRFLDLVSKITTVALLPLALSLGLDIFIVMEVLAGTGAAVFAGALFTGLALWFWYGLEFIRREHRSMKRSHDTHPVEPDLSTRIDQMLTEARVIIPGAQALLGFQLTIVLTKVFSELPGSAKTVHALALGCIALAVMLLMTPAAYHRLVYGGEDNQDMVRTGTRLITSATVPLALGLSADVYVTATQIAGSSAVGVFAAALALAALVGLWHIYPLVARRKLAQRVTPSPSALRT